MKLQEMIPTKKRWSKVGLLVGLGLLREFGGKVSFDNVPSKIIFTGVSAATGNGKGAWQFSGPAFADGAGFSVGTLQLSAGAILAVVADLQTGRGRSSPTWRPAA